MYKLREANRTEALGYAVSVDVQKFKQLYRPIKLCDILVGMPS